MMPRKVMLAITTWAIAAGVLAAHDLGAEVHLRRERLEVRAFFDDGTWARRAHVQLLRPDNRECLAEARTDEQGRAWLPLPSPGKYLLRVHAGAGHVHEEWLVIPAERVSSTESTSFPDPGVESTDAIGSLISSGPTYEEATRFQWVKLVVGLASLLTVALVAWWTLRYRQPRSHQANVQG